MSDHILTLILLLTIPPSLFFAAVKLRQYLLNRQISYSGVIEMINPGILAFFTMYFAVPTISSRSSPFTFLLDIYVALTFASLIIGSIILARDLWAYYESSDSENPMVYYGSAVIILFIIFAILLEELVFASLLAVFSFFISLALSVLVIGMGIAISPLLLDYFSARRLGKDGVFGPGDKITVFANQEISGTILSMNSTRVVIGTEQDGEYHLQPRKILEHGFFIQSKVENLEKQEIPPEVDDLR